MTTDARNVFDMKKWPLSFRKLVEADAHAARSWRRLTEAGVDPYHLTWLLALSCEFSGNPASALIEDIRTEMLGQVRKALKLADRLETNVEELRDFVSELPEGLLGKMTEGTNQLRQSAHDARRLVSKHKLNTTFFFAWLITSIQESTGSPRFRDVVNLLAWAYVTYGQEMPDIGEEALRKTYSRFKKESPLKELIRPQARTKLLLMAAIFIVFTLLTSDTLSKSFSSTESKST